MVFVYIMVGCLVLALNYIIAKAFADVATDKGYTESKYFWYCFLFSVAGYLLVVALPSKEQTKKSEKSDFQLDGFKESKDEISQCKVNYSIKKC